MLCFSFWHQGAWIAAELWSLLRSVPVPKRLCHEPWAEVSRLVDSFPVSWRIYLFWHGRLKSKERVVPLQTNWDTLLIPTDLEQHDNKDTVAVFQMDDFLNYNIVLKPAHNMYIKKKLGEVSSQVWSVVSGWAGHSFFSFLCPTTDDKWVHE